MAEELALIHDSNCDFVKGETKNKEFFLRLCLNVSDEFQRANPSIPCDLFVVVDTSGSMNQPAGGNGTMTKREAVYKAVCKLPDALGPKDTLTLICYDSQAYLEFDRLQIGDRAKMAEGFEKILKRDGGTNFEKAFAMMKRTISQGKGSSQRVIFLTDGHPTEGDTPKAHGINVELANQGVVVDCLGVGLDFNFGEMKKFTNVSQGTTEILDKPDQAGEKFRSFLRECQKSLLRNVTLRLAFIKGCRDLEFGQLAPEVRYFGEIPVDRDGTAVCVQHIPAVVPDFNYTFIARFRTDLPPASAVSRYEFIEAQLSYEIAAERRKVKSPSRLIGVHLTDGREPEERNSQIEADFDEIVLVRISEDINQAWIAKNWTEVGKLLNQKRNLAKKRRLVQQEREAEMLIEELKKNGALTEDQINKMYRSSSTTRTKARFKQQAEDEVQC